MNDFDVGDGKQFLNRADDKYLYPSITFDHRDYYTNCIAYDYHASITKTMHYCGAVTVTVWVLPIAEESGKSSSSSF